MKIFDISQEVFSCCVYPGDPSPKKETLCSMQQGDLYNLTAFSMCAHNGTHVDAPNHFLLNGADVSRINLESTVGEAYVTHLDGVVTKTDALNILNSAEQASANAKKRILIGGDATVSLEAAQVFADAGVLLLGNNSQTVGPKDAPMTVHKVLLEKNVVLLEGLRLNNVKQGVYFLCAQPLNLKEADGAPTRAILLQF